MCVRAASGEYSDIVVRVPRILTKVGKQSAQTKHTGRMWANAVSVPVICIDCAVVQIIPVGEFDSGTALRRADGMEINRSYERCLFQIYEIYGSVRIMDYYYVWLDRV